MTTREPQQALDASQVRIHVESQLIHSSGYRAWQLRVTTVRQERQKVHCSAPIDLLPSIFFPCQLPRDAAQSWSV